MKFSLKFLAVSLLVFMFVVGCAKRPEQEIAAAKAAVDEVVKEGGDKYAASELSGINSALSAAVTEADTQDKKFFKNFDAAKAQLAKVTSDAQALKGVVVQRREEAKKQAIENLAAATTAIETAKADLEKAPKGKDTRADIEMMKADLAGIEQTITEIQPLIDGGDYLAAKDKGAMVLAKAQEISAQVAAAIEKTKGKRK